MKMWLTAKIGSMTAVARVHVGAEPLIGNYDYACHHLRLHKLRRAISKMAGTMFKLRRVGNA